MNKTIMTVDDSASVRLMVNFTLKELGYEIIEAENGKDALNKLAANKINIFCKISLSIVIFPLKLRYGFAQCIL